MKKEENKKEISQETISKIVVGFISITIGLAMLTYTVGTIFNLKRSDYSKKNTNEGHRIELEDKTLRKIR